MGIIYCTVNRINGKMYVGSDTHNRSLEEYAGSGVLIKKAVKKYGIENFVKIVLEEADNQILREREDAWLKQLNVSTDKNFYNMIDFALGKPTKTSFKPKNVPWNKGKKTGTSWNKGKKYNHKQYEAITDGQTKRVETIKAKNSSRTKEELKAIYGNALGKKWYKNEFTNQSIKVFPGQEPNGFVPGRLRRV